MPRLHFKGKVFVENHHLAVPFHELLPVREKGLSERASLRDMSMSIHMSLWLLSLRDSGFEFPLFDSRH